MDAGTEDASVSFLAWNAYYTAVALGYSLFPLNSAFSSRAFMNPLMAIYGIRMPR